MNRPIAVPQGLKDIAADSQLNHEHLVITALNSPSEIPIEEYGDLDTIQLIISLIHNSKKVSVQWSAGSWSLSVILWARRFRTLLS